MTDHVRKHLHQTDIVLCEVCDVTATHIYQIERHGAGGGHKRFDEINNLIAMCDSCYTAYCMSRELNIIIKNI